MRIILTKVFACLSYVAYGLVMASASSEMIKRMKEKKTSKENETNIWKD